MEPSEETLEHSTSGGWLVTIAAASIGMLLGILYAWSVIRSAIPASWGWSEADKALPYSVAFFVFALTMVPAGRLQDRLGPRLGSSLSGVMCGLGCLISGLSGPWLPGFVMGFGVLTGAGIGFGYAAVTPAAVKWFPPHRTGLIAGIVVAGFGLAPVLIAPVSSALLHRFATTSPSGVVELGVSQTLLSLGVATIVLVSALSLLIRNPVRRDSAVVAGSLASPQSEPTEAAQPPRGLLRDARFWLLWAMYFAGGAAGLTFISVAQDLGKRSLGEWAFLAVVVLGVGNSGGRILGGLLSDRWGRHSTLFAAFVAQSAVVGALFVMGQFSVGEWPLTLAVLVGLGLNYGANLSIFPAICKDYYGLEKFGFNYGILFTSWGSAGLLMPWLYGQIGDRLGGYDLAYALIVGLLLMAAALTLLSRRWGAPSSS
jgi:MFS family permease